MKAFSPSQATLASLWLLAALATAPTALSQVDSSLSFFITSANPGKGASLGGLAGADAHCKTLAQGVGTGSKTWRAYLSTQGTGAVNARDRIGPGPWFNAKKVRIAKSVADLHGDSNNIGKLTALTEKGDTVKGRGDNPNQHDMLTGSKPDGTAFASGADSTCANWTSGNTGGAQLGHFDRQGGGVRPTSWNSAHLSSGCSIPNLVSTGGAGYFYCFADGGPMGILGPGSPGRHPGMFRLHVLSHPLRSDLVHRFELPMAGEAEVAVYSWQGRKVATLLRGPMQAGNHSVRWDGRDQSGRILPAGVYLFRLITERSPRASLR